MLYCSSIKNDLINYFLDLIEGKLKFVRLKHLVPFFLNIFV